MHVPSLVDMVLVVREMIHCVQELTLFIPKHTHWLKTSVKSRVPHWYVIFNWLIELGDSGVGYSGSNDGQPRRPLPLEELVIGV